MKPVQSIATGAAEPNSIDYELIAAEYLKSPHKPLRRLVERFNKPHTTIARWVRECRRRGLIPPVGYGYVTDSKLRDVASALGLDPQDLAAAILEMADGRIDIARPADGGSR